MPMQAAAPAPGQIPSHAQANVTQDAGNANGAAATASMRMAAARFGFADAHFTRRRLALRGHRLAALRFETDRKSVV